MKAVKDSGLGIITVAQGAAEVLSQTSGNYEERVWPASPG